MSGSRIVVGAVAGAVLLWWFVAGSRLVALVDRVTTVPDTGSVPPTEFVFDEPNPSTFESGALSFGSRRRVVNDDWKIVARPEGQMALETPRGGIMLGKLKRWSVSGERHSYTFVPAAGDSVVFTRRRSRIAWPRPFVISWLGGRLPFWSRYVYERLVWRTPNGDVLDVVWRDEQRLEPSSGWMDQYTPWPPRTSVTQASH